MLFSTKVPCSVALLCKLPQFYTNLKNLPFAMNEKNGIGESKPKQSRCQRKSALELPIGRAYAVESLAVGKVLTECVSDARRIRFKRRWRAIYITHGLFFFTYVDRVIFLWGNTSRSSVTNISQRNSLVNKYVRRTFEGQ